MLAAERVSAIVSPSARIRSSRVRRSALSAALRPAIRLLASAVPPNVPPIPCIDPDTEPRDRRSKRYKTNANHATWDHISDRLDAVQRPRTLLSWMTAGVAAVASGLPGL